MSKDAEVLKPCRGKSDNGASGFCRYHFRPHFLQHSGFRLAPASVISVASRQLWSSFCFPLFFNFFSSRYPQNHLLQQSIWSSWFRPNWKEVGICWTLGLLDLFKSFPLYPFICAHTVSAFTFAEWLSSIRNPSHDSKRPGLRVLDFTRAWLFSHMRSAFNAFRVKLHHRPKQLLLLALVLL